MTIEERILPYVVAAARRNLNMAADPVDFRDVANDPEMLAYAKAEIQRLRQKGGRRVLAEHDHESKIRCEALERILAQGLQS